MEVVFVSPGFCLERLRLQPWVTVLRVADGLRERGHGVSILTDAGETFDASGVPVLRVSTLRPYRFNRVARDINRQQPDCVVMAINPTTLAVGTALFRAIEAPIFASFSYPMYSWAEAFHAVRSLGWRRTRAHLRHRLVPDRGAARLLRRHFSGVFCQSERTASRLIAAGVPAPKVNAILPGIDVESFYPDEGRAASDGSPALLYLGAASELRGFFQFLDAAVLLARDHPGAVFRALLRGATDLQVDEIVRGSIPTSLRERFTFLGGWLEPSSLRAEISKARAVVLPFVLVPAELPLSVMEALACGTPVITTNLAGLPNAVGSCGLVVEPGDTQGLFSAMRVLQEDKRTRSAIERRCRAYAEAPRGWLDAVVEWESFLLAGLAHP